MRWRRNHDWGILALVLMVCLALSAAACRSLPQSQRIQESERWICPEYADLPLREGRYQEAVEQHLKVLGEEPDNALAHYHLGYAYGQLGAHPEEVREYLRAVDLGLVQEDLYYNLGMAYGELGAFPQAEQAFAKAVSLAPESGENHRALGMAYYQQKHFLEAVASCQRATVLAPADPEAWHCLALALLGVGRTGESRLAVEQLLRLDPAYPLEAPLLDLVGVPGSESGSP
jgi:Flp pilus assembly protein TadD